MTNHSPLEYESDSQMHETSTNAETNYSNPLLDETKPDLTKLEKQWLWHKLFAPSYSEITILFGGEAVIDKNGAVHHAMKCNTTCSSLKCQIECDCKWIDKRDPCDSDSVDALQQLKLALEQIKKEAAKKP